MDEWEVAPVRRDAGSIPAREDNHWNDEYRNGDVLGYTSLVRV